MVLNNIGAETTTSQYDVRSSSTGNLAPDPYSAIMANCDFPSITQSTAYNNKTGQTDIIYQTSSTDDALEIYVSSTAQEFGHSTTRTYLTGKTAKEKAEVLTETLLEHPEGIMVRVDGVEYDHTLVFASSNYTLNKSMIGSINAVKLTPEIEQVDYLKEKAVSKQDEIQIKSAVSTGYEQYFKVYDPGTSQTVKGDNVIFNNSWTFINHNCNINSITYFDVVNFD